MFAVIYRGYVKFGYEEEYKKLWNFIANYFITERGALGSCLHRTEEGLWVAYSRWPDKKTRDASWTTDGFSNSDLPYTLQQTILAIKDCMDNKYQFPEICMEIIDDLLLT